MPSAAVFSNTIVSQKYNDSNLISSEQDDTKHKAIWIWNQKKKYTISNLITISYETTNSKMIKSLMITFLHTSGWFLRSFNNWKGYTSPDFSSWSSPNTKRISKRWIGNRRHSCGFSHAVKIDVCKLRYFRIPAVFKRSFSHLKGG